MRLAWHGRTKTYSIVRLNEGVVDGNDLDVVVLNSIAENNATNAAKAVDANLDDHFVCDTEER